MKHNKRYSETYHTNNITNAYYINRLTELAISTFEWVNLPDTVDARFLELTLLNDGMCVFFYDDDGLGYLALQTMIGGNLNVYRIPTLRTAYATNGYNRELNEDNSVIIFNNLLHTNNMSEIRMFAKRLYECDRTIDVNIKAQKTPVMITCDENQRLTMKNLYAQYEGNEPFIFGGKDLDLKKVQALTTGAPYIAGQVQENKVQIWNEAMTYFGISNISMIKRERLVSDEVSRNMGSVVMSRYSRLSSRKTACEQINKMFGLNLDVKYREDVQFYADENIDLTHLTDEEAEEREKEGEE